MHTTHLRRAGAVLAALALTVAACGDDDQTASSGGTSTTVADMVDGHGDDHADPDEPAELDEPAERADQVIELAFTDGEITGGGRIPVDLGDSVLVQITSDVADEVHLHGYDLVVALMAGEPAELRFDATIPGVFELELHDARLPLAELEIS